MKKIVLILLAIIVSSVGVNIALAGKTAALSGSDFKAGRIIDDSIFYNSSAISPDQIQTFFNTKVSTCDTNGTKDSTHWDSADGRYYTRAEWGTKNGYPPPYTCLKDYRQDIPATAADNYCKSISDSTSQLASEILYQVAQACSINPEVLVVLLQKEQALVTDDWPWSSEYQSATGYGCPDTGSGCDSAYYGYFNQVYHAARQYQMYSKLPSSYSYHNNGTFFVPYNPDSSCGGLNVDIETQATADLYNYTPYVPNSAALSSLGGNGDSCSSFGNRNFWVYFNDWFGSPTVTTDQTQQAQAQHRIKAISTSTTKYVFYYDAYQQVLRMTTTDLGTGTVTSSILDGSSSLGGGRIDASLGSSIDAAIYNNYIQLYYYDKTHGNLRHGWTDANGWHFETLDGDSGSISHYSGDVGINPSVINYNGNLQVYYYDRSNGNLRHAWTDATGWHFENLDGDSGSIAHHDSNVGLYSTAINYNGYIQLFYFDGGLGNLRHAWTDATGWHFENLDGDSGSIAHHDSNVGLTPVALNYNGCIQLFYYDSDYSSLRHAWTDATGWHFEALDGSSVSISKHTGNVGVNPSAGVYSNYLQVYYYDRSNGNLRHAWTNATGWHFENLDGDSGSIAQEDGDIGAASNLITSSSSLDIYYLDRSSGNLKHGYPDTAGWHFENIAPSIVY